MHALSIPIVCLPVRFREQWTTESRFPGGRWSTASRNRSGYLWIGTDRGLIRFDGLNFRPALFFHPTALNITILQLLTDARGTLWIRPEGALSRKPKDGEFQSVRYGLYAITAMSKDNHDGSTGFGHRAGHIPGSGQTTFRNGTRFLASNLSAETARRQDLDWQHSAMALFFLRAGDLRRSAQDVRPKDQLSAAGSVKSCGSAPTRAFITGEQQRLSSVKLPPFLGSVQVLSILRDRDSNIWVGTARGLLRSMRKAFVLREKRAPRRRRD